MKTPFPEEWLHRAPQLGTIAKWLNANTTLTATIEKSYSSTDSKISGTRFIRKGKGRRGNKLTVMLDGKLVFSHDSSQTYRENAEVVRWLRDYLQANPKVVKNIGLRGRTQHVMIDDKP